MAPAHAAWIEQAMAGLDREDAAQLWQSLGQLKASAGPSMRRGRTAQKIRS
jgi:hypothetical protein